MFFFNHVIHVNFGNQSHHLNQKHENCSETGVIRVTNHEHVLNFPSHEKVGLFFLKDQCKRKGSYI